MGTICFGTELFLENQSCEDAKMRVIPDYGGSDYVAFVFSYKGKVIPIDGSKKVEGNAEEYFHIDKNQVGFLIDFLKRLYDDMDYPKE